MVEVRQLDCVVIGHNEMPFSRYEELVGQYGTDSEAYRDLRMSFVEVAGRKMSYIDLMNHFFSVTHNGDGVAPGGPFRSGDIPALAAAYLTNYLRRRGFTASYVNLFQEEKGLLADLLAQRPLTVAITTTLYVWNFPVHEMVEFIRTHNEETKIIVGGPLIANHSRNYEGNPDSLEAVLFDMGADIYVAESQGEATLTKIISCLKAGGDLGRVPNLYYFEQDDMLVSAVESESNSMDENYIDWMGLADHDLGPTVQTRTARSCAFTCAFCNYPSRAGKLSLAGVDTVKKELDAMRELGVRNVVFIDDTFNVPLPRFKDLCRLMIEENYGFEWYSYFRCGNSDEEAVDLMARSGCSGVFLGIESGSPTVLKNMAKAATVEKYLKGIELLRQRGILTFGSFITGFPSETDATVAETIDFIKAADMDFYRTQLWYCEKGTPIDHRRDEFGIEGDGFIWSHSTMDSKSAMDHIERMFLSIEGPIWLPQWSFDFWIIPYLIGKGLSRDDFKNFTGTAHRILELDLVSEHGNEKDRLKSPPLAQLEKAAGAWQLRA